jgi:hypothetical protein
MIEKLMCQRIMLEAPPGGGAAIAKHLYSRSLEQLRRFLLGESQTVLFHRSQKSGLEGTLVIHLTQNRLHKLARLLTLRATYYRKWPRHKIVYV